MLCAHIIWIIGLLRRLLALLLACVQTLDITQGYLFVDSIKISLSEILNIFIEIFTQYYCTLCYSQFQLTFHENVPNFILNFGSSHSELLNFATNFWSSKQSSEHFCEKLVEIDFNVYFENWPSVCKLVADQCEWAKRREKNKPRAEISANGGSTVCCNLLCKLSFH